MKGDVILRLIISFLIPFIIMYSFSYIFFIFEIGFLAILNFVIYILISYALFHIRFEKINISKTFSVAGTINLFLLLFFVFLCFLTYKLMEV